MVDTKKALAVIISIHAPHEGERLPPSCPPPAALCISIHAPHEGERLHRGCLSSISRWYFNPRSPRGGATGRSRARRDAGREFQSTLPTRGSDLFAFLGKLHRLYFNPRSPRGGATVKWVGGYTVKEFQSTLPTRGSDPLHCILVGDVKLFQSTLPTRGSDEAKYRPGTGRTHFNPRSPRGGATSAASRSASAE